MYLTKPAIEKCSCRMNRLFFGVLIFAAILMASAWFYAIDSLSLKHMYLSGELVSTETTSKLCIEENICKPRPDADHYVYRRTETFDKMLRSPKDVHRNIVHENRVIPSLVHFTWFGGLQKNNFRFHHLISVLAAHKHAKPKRIYFWFDLIPDGDYFKELKEKVPELFLIYRNTPKEIYGRPVTVSEHVTDVVRLEALLEYGGMYFDLDAIVLKPLDPILKYDTVMGYESSNRLCNGIIISIKWAEFLKIWHEQYKTFDDKKWQFHSVEVPGDLAKLYPQLIHTEEKSLHRPNWTQEEAKQLYEVGNLYDWKTNNYVVHLWIRQHKIEHNPTDIKTWNTTVGSIFRYIYYGNSDITGKTNQNVTNLCLEPNICKDNTMSHYFTYHRNDTFNKMLNSAVNYKKNITHKERVIPSLVHFTWYGGPQKNHFRFHHMLGILAAHKFIKPARIFLWIDMIPEGSYFKEMQEKVPEVYLIHRKSPTEIFGRPVKVSEHMTDIVRLEAVMEYGGMYFDLDAMVVKSLDPLLNYEMVMGYEYGTGLCNGVIIAVAWADFLKIWHSKYVTFQDGQWAEHSVTLPARLAKEYKGLIHTEEKSLHRPNWTPGELPQLYGEGNIYDWKKNNYIVHLWIRKYGKERDPENIKKWNTTVGQIFRYIYYGNSDIIQ